jgi:nucleotidyltransferase/DNA polymerase involved in DNA repair
MRIACVYIPRFAVEAERQRRPDIASRLVLIGEAKVFDCSLGAATSGVVPGMRMTEAISHCQKALVLPPDAPYYQRCFSEVLDFLQEHSPDVEAGDSGVAYVSLDGFVAPPEALADELISALHKRLGYMASVGVAGGKFAARIAAATSRPGIAKVLVGGTEAAFLAPLPCTHLPASEAMVWRLGLLGIETMGDIAKLPLGAFQQQFGPEGKRGWELASGLDSQPLVRRNNEEAILRRMELPAPTANLDAILIGLERLLSAAYSDTNRQGRWVRRVVVRAVLDGGGAWELPVHFREALCDLKVAWFAVKNAVLRHPPERPVEELEAELIGLSGEFGKQAPMFENKGKLWRQVEEAARHLSAAGGSRSAIGRIVEVEPWSRIPERRAAVDDLV